MGTLTLYFYGLEYRFFVEQPDIREREIILDEVKRLLTLPTDPLDLAFEMAAVRSFVTVAEAIMGSYDDRDPLSTVELAQGLSKGFEFTFAIKHAVGRMTEARKPFTAEWLLSWYLAHPSSPPMRTPAKRVPDEFMALFRLLFDEKYPGGYQVHVPKGTVLRTRYVGSSGLFTCWVESLRGRVPDCSRLRSPLTQARKLVDLACDALKSYSYFVERYPERKDTIQAHVLLPPRIRPLFPSPPMREFAAWVEAILDAGEQVTVMQVVHSILDSTPKRLPPKHAVLAARALEALGYGMVPDARASLRNPRPSDPIVLFEIPPGESEGPDAPKEYSSLLLMMAAGMYVAHIGMPTSPYVRDTVLAWLDDWKLSPYHRARAFAHLAWFAQVCPDMTAVRRHLRAAANDTRQETRLLALAVAAADGIVQADKERALGRIYNAVGLPLAQARSDLQSLGTLGDFVTTRLDRESRRVRSILKPRKRRKIQLDDARILDLLKSSAQAYRELERIFADSESGGTTSNRPEQIPALDTAYAEFLRTLVTKPHWEATELSVVAQGHQIMLEGALEAINDWCSELFGDILVQEHDGFDLDPVVRSHLQPLVDA